MKTGRFGGACACLILFSAVLVAAAPVAGSASAARRAVTLQQLDATYRGPSAVVDALRSAEPHARALARADFDGDGAADLVLGYAWRGAGIITVQRGNSDAFAPKRTSPVFQQMQRGGVPDWMAADARAVRVPEAVSSVAAGDFNRDGRPDALAAAQGGSLYLLAGVGHGGLGAAQKVSLPGRVTTVATGEFRAADGNPEVAVGVATRNGAKLLVFDGARGLRAKPMRFSLPGKATAIQFGGLDADPYMDVAVAAGGRLEIIHGWGRERSPSRSSRVERVGASGVRGIAIGYFIRDRAGLNEIAAAFDDGTVRLVIPANLDTRPFTAKELRGRGRARMSGKRISHVAVESLPGWHPSAASGWRIGEPLARGVRASADELPQNLLATANVSMLETNDLLIADASPGVHLVRAGDSTTGILKKASTASALDAALDSATAVLPLPQKVNGDRGVVTLGKSGGGAGITTIAAARTLNVDRTDDPSGANLTAASACLDNVANDCSLRGAVQYANQAANAGSAIVLGANTYTLSIPGAGGGCVAGDDNTTGDLEMNQSTTITGVAGSTVIRQTRDGSAATGDRVICLNAPLALNKVYSFSGITITGGRDTSGIGGGGIIGGEKGNALTLDAVTISNNQTTGNSVPGGGGGVVITGGDFTITNSTIGGSNAPGANRNDASLGNWSVTTSGGGLGFTPSAPAHTAATGTLNVTNTKFDHNAAGSTSGNGGGGADLYTLAFAMPGGIGTGSANFSGSTTFTSNQAKSNLGGSGGGIFAESLGGTIASTSFTSNSATNRGGAIYVAGGNGITLNGTSPSVTFTGNTATSAGSTISTAGTVNVTGTNVTLGGDVEITGGGIWTNNAGSAISPTNLIISGGTFNANDSTTNMSGNFTFSPTPGNEIAFPGTFNSGTGTFNFNGSGAQSILGPNSPIFNNLVVNKPSGTLTLGVNSSVKSNLTVTSGILDLGAFTANRTAAGGVLTVNNGATLKIGGTGTLPANYATHALGTTSTVEYYGAGAQTIAATNYGHLTSSSSGTRTLASSGTIGVAGTFTPGSNTYTVTGSTVDFNGAGAQTIPAFNYNNLTSSNTGARTLASSGTIGVAGVFTPGTNAYTIAGSTVNFNGAVAQTIPAFNYFNLSSSSTGARTLPSSGTVGVAGTFTPGTNTYTIAGSTIDFNGSGAQTIPAFNYNNLTSSNTGARTLASSGTIGVAGVFTPGTNAYTIAGSTVNFNGAGAQTIPAFNYFNLTSSSTGARTLAASGTIGVAGAFTPGGNAYTTAGSTIDYNGSGAQTITAFNYNNLTSSSTGARTLPSGQTIGIAGVFTPGTNTFTITGSTIDFNGAGAQTIPAFNFNNLTSSNSGARTLAGSGTVGVAGTFTPGTNAYTIAGSTVNFNGAGAQTIPAFNYFNLSSSSSGARTLPSSGTVGVAGTFTPGTNTYTIAGSTVDFNGAGAQTIPAFNYNNLTSSSTGARTLAASGTIGVAGTFTPGSNAYTIAGSTVNFNGAGAQTIPAFNYFNLTSSSTGARTLPSSGTVGVAGTFTPGTNTYTIAGSTIDFNGAGAQTIPAFNYNNLTSSNSGARTLASSGTIGVAGVFTPGGNAYTVTGSTVNFNGAGAQTIPAFNYNNLTSSSTGARTLAASGTIGVAGTFTPGGNAYTVAGSTVSFNGSGAQTIPAFTFNNLTDANAAATVSLTAAITVNGALTVNAGAVLDTTTFVLTLSGAYTNNGQIRHSASQLLNTTVGPFTFADGLGVETFRATGLSAAFGNTTTNTAAGGADPYNTCTGLPANPVRRFWQATPATSGSATARFSFRNDEIAGGLGTDQLAIYRCLSGGAWTQVGTTYTRPAPAGPAAGYSSVEATAVPFSSAGATYIVGQGTPDLAVTKTNNVSGATTLGSSWTWTLHVTNTGTANAVFADGQTILLDNLPNSNISYGSASVTNVGTGVTGTVGCAIASNDLTCTASGGSVTLGTTNSSFDVVFTATPSSAGTFANPRSGGSCSADPNNNNAESNEANNGCSNSVTVAKVDTTTTITSDAPDPSAGGQSVTVNYTVVPTGSGTPTGNVQVSDGVDSCTGTVAAGSCNVTLTTGGARTLTAHYLGDTSFNESTSLGEPHTVDASAPDTTIDTNPTNPTTSSSASFTFSGTDTGSGVASFECKLDGGSFTACTSPQGYPGPLADGSHTFQVRAIDAVGNVDATPASFTWTIDTSAPDTTIDTNPSNPTASTSASFTFSGTDTGTGVASFECKLDAGSFSACTSPQNYPGPLADGSHTFQVRAIDGLGTADPTPASFTWTIDGSAPDTTIDTNPTNPSTSSSASFTFSGTDTGTGVASFECKLDAGSFSACTSPQSYPGPLSDGSHTFQVRAIDGVGHVDATPASFTWTIDTTAPDTTINTNPSNPSTSSSASFTFSGTDTGTGVASFECKLDGGSFTGCTSPQSYPGPLIDGSHTFQVRAIDGAGNVDASPASFTWTIDTSAPDTSIDAPLPADPTKTNSTFHFSGTDSGTGVASFECKLDGGAFAACTEPFTTSLALDGSADGSHTFQVRAIDGVGNADATPASFTWKLDTTAPSVTINEASGQADPTTASPIHFTAVFNESVTGFTAGDVSFGGTAGATDILVTELAPNDGTTYDVAVSGMATGGTVFATIPAGAAADAATNLSTASSSTDNTVTFVADNVAPDTSITANPSDPTNDTSPDFSFNGSDDVTPAGSLTFECKLDAGSFTACTSPQNYPGPLGEGSHTFQVRAIDAANNVDATPASFTWTIDISAPDTTISGNPPNPTNLTSASFSFSGADANAPVPIRLKRSTAAAAAALAGFECQLDGSGFAGCTSPQNYSGLAPGSHTFQVRAIDGAGNADPSPASFTWKIDTTAPAVAINQASGQADPTNLGPIHFTAVFSESVTGFTAGDVSLSGTAGATDILVAELAPNDGTTYDVSVSGMTVTGLVIASIPAGAAADAATNLSGASTSTDNTVSFVGGPTAVTIASAVARRANGAVVVRWRTGTEVDVLGFNVYRKLGSRQTKLNRHVIAAHYGTAGGAYSFRDRREPKSQRVRYWLQIVRTDRSRSWIGPLRP